MLILPHRDADRQIVDHRNHLAQMVCEKPVEQHLVPVMQSRQECISAQRIRQPLILAPGSFDLCSQGGDVGRQQSVQSQRLSFLRGERRALIQRRRVKHRETSGAGFLRTGGGFRPLRTRQSWDHYLLHG